MLTEFSKKKTEKSKTLQVKSVNIFNMIVFKSKLYTVFSSPDRYHKMSFS